MDRPYDLNVAHFSHNFNELVRRSEGPPAPIRDSEQRSGSRVRLGSSGRTRGLKHSCAREDKRRLAVLLICLSLDVFADVDRYA